MSDEHKDDVFEEVLGEEWNKSPEDSKEKSISNLAELENAEEEHVMDPTDNSEKEDMQEQSTELTDPTMEGMQTFDDVQSAENPSAINLSPKPLSGKSLKDRVEEKGLNVFLSEDNKTLRCKSVMGFSNIGKRTIEDYKPSQEDLDIINKNHSNMEVGRDDILCFTLRSADIAVDRSYEHFTDGALTRMAQMSVGKSFLIDHKWETPSHVGKIYAAKAVDGKLLQKVYIANEDFNRQIIKNILLGIYNKVSVGFGVDLNAMVCDSCGSKSYYDESCPHMVGNQDEKGYGTTITIKDISDYYEVSLVPVPAQRDAGITRGFSKSAEQLDSSTQELIKATASAQRPETLENPELLLKDLKEVMETNRTEEIINSSATISNGKSVLGDVAVPNEEDKSKELSDVPAVDAKPAHCDTSAENKEDAVQVPGVDEKGCMGMDNDDDEEDNESAKKEAAQKLAKALKKLTKQAKKQRQEQKSSYESQDAKSKALADQIKSVSDRLDILCQIIEAAMNTSADVLTQEKAMYSHGDVRKAKSATEVYTELTNLFISGGN